MGGNPAVGLLKTMLPEESDVCHAPAAGRSLPFKLVLECIGTFALVLIAGLNILVHFQGCKGAKRVKGDKDAGMGQMCFPALLRHASPGAYLVG